MAIELKEKEKNLLIQSFEYGDSHERDDIHQSIVAQGKSMAINQTSRHNVFDTLNDEKTIH